MNTRLKLLQWLLFWFVACLPLAAMPLAGMATGVAPTATPVQDFASTEPLFETLRDAETIDNQPITALAQDARGLIWIGTQFGLIRYDGYHFRQFSYQSDDPFSLSSDYVFSLYAAPDGRIWVGTTNDGISVFDPASERFEHFRHDDAVPHSLSGGRISAFASDGAGGMWIATDQGLNHLPHGTKRFTHFRHGTNPRSLLSNKVRSLLRDKAGQLWVGSSDGLQRLAPDGKSFDTFVTGRNVQTMLQARDGKLWLGTAEHGAGWLDIAKATSQQTSPPIRWLPLAQLSHPWITGISQRETGQISLATYGGGIIVVAPDDGRVLQTLRHDPALPGSLAFDAIGAMLMDRAGWLWVGTWGAGLQRMNANNNMLRILKHSAKRGNGLSHPDVRSMLELANGQWLIGSKGNGIDLFDRQRGVIKGYRAGSGQPDALPDAVILALAQSSDGSIWAGTEQVGVIRQPVGSSTWEVVPGLPSKQVNKLLISRDGSLWAGTAHGVARYQPGQPNQPNQPAQPPSAPTSRAAATAGFEAFADDRGNLMEAPVTAMAEDRQGRVWIGTDNGLWLYEPGQRGVIRIPAEPKRPDGLISDSILGLLFDRHERLWLATDKGLERLTSWDGKLARFEHISVQLGLPGKSLGSNLLEDRQGRIWTEQAVIEPGMGRAGLLRISYLKLADSLAIGTTWQGAYGQTRDGLLLFGGVKGLAVIDPAHYKAADYAPPLVVTEIKINGQTVAPAMLANLKNQTGVGTNVGTGVGTDASTSASLTLSPAQRNFAIEFSALDYSDPQKNRYQYRLQGYDKNWINTDAEHRSASYGNLWPGSYTLQVRGSNRVGDWSKHELIIPIRVLPAWWQTWWFGTLLLLLMGGLMLTLVQIRTRYLRQRQRELQQRVDEQTGELRQKHTELAAAHHQLQETQQQLMLQEKMAGLGTLTAGVAHEINNPTNFVHVAAQNQQIQIAEFERFVASLIEDDEGQVVLQAFNQRFGKLSDNVAAMLTGTLRIIAIVKDLRSFSRLDESARKTVHLSECLSASVNLVRTGWLEKVDFITEISDDPELECWPALLNQVFFNLLLNGCQAIEAKQAQGSFSPGLSADQPHQQRGKLWLRQQLNPGKDALQIVFEDNGVGIEPAIQSRIMEPFFTTKEVGSGTGTGLSTAFGIVQKHGGRLEFTSSPGAGSCFTVTLPLPGVREQGKQYLKAGPKPM